MQNNTNFSTISLDNLNTVTGGYHDPVDPELTCGRRPFDGATAGAAGAAGAAGGAMASAAARSMVPPVAAAIT